MYLKNVLCPIVLVSFVSFVIQYNIYAIFEHNFVSFLIFGFLSLLLTLTFIYCLGMDGQERCMINKKAMGIIKKF